MTTGRRNKENEKVIRERIKADNRYERGERKEETQ
jgi:hypothetical protein